MGEKRSNVDCVVSLHPPAFTLIFSMPGMEDLVLDPRIRDWVLIPIVFIMTIIGLLRHYITLYLRSTPISKLENVRDKQLLLRAKNLKANHDWIPRTSFYRRKRFFNHKTDGKLKETREKINPMEAMANNPMMSNMMMSNAAMVIPQIITMNLVNTFFFGFVMVRLPFPMSSPFKAMLQRGVNLADLDADYVSSLSWYLLNLFGLRGIFSLVLAGGNAADEGKLMKQQMGQAGPQAGMEDMGALFKAASEDIEILHHEWKLNGVVADF